jgi:hypothetical protein
MSFLDLILPSRPPRTPPSSTLMAAPWARYGSVAWAASPRRQNVPWGWTHVGRAEGSEFWSFHLRQVSTRDISFSNFGSHFANMARISSISPFAVLTLGGKSSGALYCQIGTDRGEDTVKRHYRGYLP